MTKARLIYVAVSACLLLPLLSTVLPVLPLGMNDGDQI